MAWGKRQRSVLIAVVIVLLCGSVALTLILANRSKSDGQSAPGATPTTRGSSTATVIVPGRPGESATTVPADEVKAPDGSAYNGADALFLRMMIPHHAQAVEMAALAPSRARNPQIRGIADRIRVAQPGEIAYMRAWLQARGLDERLAGHEHGSMRGMQSPEAMRALAAAKGDSFDRMFVDMMTKHHQGAIDMSTDLLKVGKDVQIEQLATGIASEQGIEIGRMREALAG